MVQLSWRGADGVTHRHQANPATGALLPPAETLGGRGFFYPFHYNLNIKAAGVGVWIVAAAAMAMLLLLVSGIVIHIRIFADFFLMRAYVKRHPLPRCP